MTASKLISQLGFLQGMASTLDISGNLASLDIADDSMQADRDALASDWAIVGQELQKAMNMYEQR
ncbi:hypothetical protein [uncultured Selenomonas sp.]|uniref:hypothetical protein n=1 Tax=uncultured Selenomonas sp. TaxID=159275 RepID=UPI002589A0F3|nr:hypothetical protein [uncultured Selenomonas sp.]